MIPLLINMFNSTNLNLNDIIKPGILYIKKIIIKI